MWYYIFVYQARARLTLPKHHHLTPRPMKFAFALLWMCTLPFSRLPISDWVHNATKKKKRVPETCINNTPQIPAFIQDGDLIVGPMPDYL